MRKKIGIETTYKMEISRTHEKSGTSSPENLGGLIVLPVIHFIGPQDTPPAKRVTQPVQPSPRRTGVLEFLWTLNGANFGLTGREFRMGIQKIHHGCPFSVPEFHIRI